MKLFGFTAALFLATSAMAQIGTGPAVRQTNSSATGVTLKGTTLLPGGSSISSAGVFSGNGGALSNLPPASATSSGSIDATNFSFSQSTPDWQSRMERTPWLGNLAATEAVATNEIAWHAAIGRRGYNIMMTFETMYARFRVGGHLVINPTNFPSGLAGYKDILRTNGWRLGMWYDSANATDEGVASLAQFVDDIKTICSTFAPRVLWVDETDQRAAIAAQIVSTNRVPIQLMFGSPPPSGLLESQVIQRGNSWRLHGSTDISSWVSFIEYCDLVESNAWQYAGPGQFFYVGPEAGGIGTSTETYTGVALQAMWGNDLLMGFCNNAIQAYGPFLLLTNQNILDIQQDGLVACARRGLTTNGCWYLVKPTEDNSYVVCVVNTNSTSTNSTINIAALNSGLQQSGFTLNAASYSVYDLRANTRLGDNNTTITNTSLASHDFALFKLTVPTQVSTLSVGLLGANTMRQVGASPNTALWFFTNVMIVDPIRGNVSIGSSGSGTIGYTLTLFHLGANQFVLDIDNQYSIGRSTADGLLYTYGNQSGANGIVFSGVNGTYATLRPNLITVTNLAIGPASAVLTNILSATAVLDFPSTVVTTSTDLPITVTGCNTNDVAELAVPFQAVMPDSSYSCYVSNNTVYVRFSNTGPTLARDPVPCLFRTLVFKVQ